MTPDADAAYIMARLNTNIVLTHHRAKLYGIIFERSYCSDFDIEHANSRADAAMKVFDAAFPRKTQESVTP